MIRGATYQMYAVLIDDVIVAGTLAYSRSAAIDNFLSPSRGSVEWKKYQKAGYRTERVAVTLAKHKEE